MLAKCANPTCNTRFRYLRQGKLFSFRGLPISDAVSRNCETKEFWWLCSDCSSHLTLKLDYETGIQVVPKSRFEMGFCTRVPSLYQAGLVESYCNRCGSFIAASTRPNAILQAEEAHDCPNSKNPGIVEAKREDNSLRVDGRKPQHREKGGLQP